MNNSEKFLDKEREYNKQLQELVSSKPQMVEDFQTAVKKDLPIEKIDKRGEILPIKSGAEFQADQLIREARKNALKEAASSPDVLDYRVLKQQFADKAKDLAKNSSARKFSLGGLAAGLATAIGAASLPESAMASTPVKAGFRALDEGDPTSLLIPGDVGPQPGSLDQRIESGTLTEDDKKLLRLQALKNFSR